MFKTVVKAFVVGSSMMVPGVSGGSMAMILGIYDRLIDAVPNLFVKNKRAEAFKFLAAFTVSALIGIILVAKPLEILITRYSLQMSYLFLGAVLGTIPMMVKKAGSKGFDFISLFWILLGAIAVFSIAYIPEGLFSPEGSSSIFGLLFQFLGGVLVSIGLVLPGISTSYLLLVLGLYEPIIKALDSYNFLFLLPISIGLVVGILALTKLLQIAMRKYPKPSFMMILGFLLASLKEIYSGFPSGLMILLCLLLLSVGFIIVYMLSKVEEQEEAKVV